jgi:hypothetical protein
MIMRDLSSAALTCAVLSGLFGLAHMFSPWNSPLQKWKSYTAAARRTLFLLAFYFTLYLVTIFIVSVEVTSHLASQLLFELCWLNGLCVEVRTILCIKAITYKNLGRLTPQSFFNTI